MNLLAFLAITVSCSTVLTYARRHFEKTQPTGNPNGVEGDGGLGGEAPAVEEPDDFEGQFTPSMRKFQRQVLKITNQFRRRHGVPILKQDARMNRYAQSWALVLALKDELHLRTKPKYGENTYKWWSTDMKAPITGKVPVTDWYNEIKKYNFSDPGFRSDIGHFTQLVWRGSRRLGTGIARSRKGNYYIVCEYEPRGNILGQFGHQVRRRLRRGGAGSDEEGGEGSEEGGRKRRRRRRRKHDDEEEYDD